MTIQVEISLKIRLVDSQVIGLLKADRRIDFCQENRTPKNRINSILWKALRHACQVQQTNKKTQNLVRMEGRELEFLNPDYRRMTPDDVWILDI